jgi:hypothetical protein
MKIKLLLPALLLAACGDNLQPDVDQTLSGAEESTEAADAPAGSLTVSFHREPLACDDHSQLFLGSVYDENGIFVVDAICEYAFSDGTTASGCRTVHSFPTAQSVTLTAIDPATGATGSYSESAFGPESFAATLDVTSDGLSISWVAHTSYGERLDLDEVQIRIEPAANVIVDDPNVFRSYAGSVNVTAAGTYAVHLDAYTDIGADNTCNATAEQTIEITCSDPH